MQWDAELYEVARDTAVELLAKAGEVWPKGPDENTLMNQLSAEETHTLHHAVRVLESMERPDVDPPGPDLDGTEWPLEGKNLDEAAEILESRERNRQVRDSLDRLQASMPGGRGGGKTHFRSDEVPADDEMAGEAPFGCDAELKRNRQWRATLDRIHEEGGPRDSAMKATALRMETGVRALDVIQDRLARLEARFPPPMLSERLEALEQRTRELESVYSDEVLERISRDSLWKQLQGYQSVVDRLIDRVEKLEGHWKMGDYCSTGALAGRLGYIDERQGALEQKVGQLLEHHASPGWVKHLESRLERTEQHLEGLRLHVVDSTDLSIQAIETRISEEQQIRRRATGELEKRLRSLDSEVERLTYRTARNHSGVEERVEKIEGRTEDLNGRIGGIDGRLEHTIRDVLGDLPRNVPGLLERVEKLEAVAHEPQPVMTAAAGAELERRMDAIEEDSGREATYRGRGDRAALDRCDSLEDRVEHIEAHVETLVEWREEWEGPDEDPPGSGEPPMPPPGRKVG